MLRFFIILFIFIELIRCAPPSDDISIEPAEEPEKQEKDIMQFDVSGDGSCMLHAAALCYLFQGRKNMNELKNRFQKIFDENISNHPDMLDEIKNTDLVALEGKTIPLSHNSKWKNLIKVLRNKIVIYLRNNDALLRPTYEGSLTGDIKAHKETYGLDHGNYDNFINETAKEGFWLTDAHIGALANILNYPITTIGTTYTITSDLPGDNPIIIFHLGGHYNFGLPRYVVK